MADKIVRANVTGDRGVFIGGILYLPGEDAPVNLTALGVDKLGDKTPGLSAKSAKDEEPVEQVPIAAVAPHAPDAPNPQGIATGTKQSGTGRLISPAALGSDAVEPVGADSESAQEQKPKK
jgi:hypothetical protein